ncbi:MAG: hypothetical protein LC791_15700 [Acidobacteria bacterium]|nr:hypothetical protein [Acidobacteriota bacterium]
MTPVARVIDFVYDRLQIESEWAVRDSNGFTWWPGPLALRVWAGPGREVQGVEMTPVHIESALLTGVDATESTLAQLAGINRLATLSAYQWTPEERVLRLRASVSVTEDNWPLARLLALHAAAIQAADAHAEAEPLADVFGGTLAKKVAPKGGVRTEVDAMLDVISLYRQRGEHGSPWSADEIAGLVHLDPRPWLRASSEERRVEAVLPWDGRQGAHLQIDGAFLHPALGSGLLIRLQVPAEPRPDVVQRLNVAELAEPDAHQLGAWALEEDLGVLFSTFVPAGAYAPNLARSLVYHAAARSDWARATLGE